MKSITIIISLAISLLSFVIHADTLSVNEDKISTHVAQQKSDSLKLLEKVVNINSGTMNFSGVKHVGDIFSDELKNLGFATHWIDGKAFNRAGHLFASYKGKYANEITAKILLIGHLDTVFAKDDKFQKFVVIDEKHIAGPAITDMKGGNVVMLSALKALKATGNLSSMNIQIMLMGDEEKRGTPYEIATKELMASGKWADIAIGFEDGDGNPKTGVISRRGATSWRLEVKGRAAHSSQIFREKYGYGAIFEAARILNEFRTALSQQPYLTFNPAVIVGGTETNFDANQGKGDAFGKNNVIAQVAVVSGDIRALSPKQLEDAKAVMQKIVNDNLTETSASLTFSMGYPPMAPTSGNEKLLAVYNQVSIDLGYGEVLAVDPQKAGAADISFVANDVDMALDGLGLMGSGGHTIREVADITTLTSQSQRAALLMYRLSVVK